ncbi:MAG: hypothetical protein MK207_11830 [Saprospiraceae bacterium]|nr:hypothetical protein [Saprospiraceae bacterium]
MLTYISPYKLFDLPLDSSEAILKANEVKVLERLKHNDENEIVQIGLTKTLKSHALQLLKELGDSNTRQYHITIFNYKKLLNFLEYGQLNYFRQEKKNSNIEDAEFWKFIAPFFGRQFGETLLKAIKTNDKDTLMLLSSESLPMTGGFEELCYKHAASYIGKTINELKQLQVQKELLHISERELLSYLPNKTIELYNILPDYFNVVRNLIATEIYSLSVVLIQNYGRSDGASAIIKQGLKLKLDESVRKNLEAMNKNFTLKSQVPTFIWVALAAVSLLYIIKFIETTFSGG